MKKAEDLRVLWIGRELVRRHLKFGDEAVICIPALNAMIDMSEHQRCPYCSTAASSQDEVTTIYP